MTRRIWSTVVVALAIAGLFIGGLLIARHYHSPALDPGTATSDVL